MVGMSTPESVNSSLITRCDLLKDRGSRGEEGHTVTDHIGSQPTYVLGNHPEELARLDRQAQAIERPTRLLLQAAGLTKGMRVLDLGSGLGHVARLAGELVGPTGSVTGIDRSHDVLAVARDRTERAGMNQVTFMDGDVTTFRGVEPFDAVVGRLLLFHVADPAGVARHHMGNLRRGGLFVAVDYDLGACRAEPPLTLVDDTIRLVEAAFRAAGAWPRIGTRLGVLLGEAGFTGISTFGIQPYLPPSDPTGPALLAGVVRTLAPAIISHGIATEEQLNVDTLEQRLTEAAGQAGSVILLPTVVGAWGIAP
jgi:SAM-dependent methyltransferase